MAESQGSAARDIGGDLLVDVIDRVATVTINRPHVKNAVPLDMWPRLHTALLQLDADADVGAIILTGVGGNFCSGADVGEVADMTGEPPMDEANACVVALHEMGTPVLAKVDGVAAGVGMNLALGCDLIIASDRAVFSEVFARRALCIDGGGSWLLPRLVGLHKAKELVLLAGVIPASEAADIGLVNRVVPTEDLDRAVGELATQLAAGPTIALRLSKHLLNESHGRTFSEAVDAESEAQRQAFASDDFREAAKAWAERRDPRFRGC